MLLAGLAGVGVWLVGSRLPQLWELWEDLHLNLNAPFSRKSPARTTVDSAPGPSGIVGRIAIPRLGLRTTVREGTGQGILLLSAGHIRGTSFPGENGNVGVAAHRDTLFSALRDIRKDDVVQFETDEGRFEYVVREIDIVDPADVAVLRAGRYPELTLVTCYPFDYLGAAPRRFIVKARQVSQIPNQELAARLAGGRAADSLPVLFTPPAKDPPRSSSRRTPFSIAKGHSTTILPGVQIGITDVDSESQRVNGWMWIMPDRKTVWLRDQPPDEPLFFAQDGREWRLTITRLTSTSAAGYVSMD